MFESHVDNESNKVRDIATVLGIAVVATPAVITYALVKDSGATVGDLSRDIWDSTKNRREHMSGFLLGVTEIVGEEIQKFSDYTRDIYERKVKPDVCSLRSLSRSMKQVKWWER